MILFRFEMMVHRCPRKIYSWVFNGREVAHRSETVLAPGPNLFRLFSVYHSKLECLYFSMVLVPTVKQILFLVTILINGYSLR